MASIAIGPQRPTPSWNWVGRALGEELAKHHIVSFFDEFGSAPEADVVLVVKQRPGLDFVHKAHIRGALVAFAPIDIYQEAGEVDEDRDMLAACDLVLLHGAELAPYLSECTSRLLEVDHHLRFALEPMAEFREEGFVLWVGATQNLMPLLVWLEKNPLPYEVRLLTNISREHWVLAQLTAYRLGLRISFDSGRINGLPAYQWSEAKQEEMMRACRAAIDIKGTDFAQATKPPTKAQQFIGSGIPFACNADSPMAQYFARRGFEIAQPHDTGHLFSKRYWSETRTHARQMRTELSLAAVADRFSRAFEQLMAGPKKSAP